MNALVFQKNVLQNNRDVYLDLCFSNLKHIDIIQAAKILLPQSYHHMAYAIEVKCGINKFLNIDIQYYDFRKANDVGRNNFRVSVNWDGVLITKDIDLDMNKFYFHLYI